MRNRWRQFAVFLIIPVGIAVLLWARTRNESPLPEAKDIESIVAKGGYGPGMTEVEFEMALEDWPQVKASLEPATRDNNPAKWIRTGSLGITMHDGSQLQVALYDTRSSTGAFAAGPTMEQRVYYRGGNSRSLDRSLSAALATAQQQNKVLSPAK